MASPVTEIAYLAFKPGVDIEGSTPEAQAWQSALTVLKAQKGFQRAVYGRLFESPNVLALFIGISQFPSPQTSPPRRLSSHVMPELLRGRDMEDMY
jgi:hypothetical protein